MHEKIIPWGKPAPKPEPPETAPPARVVGRRRAPFCPHRAVVVDQQFRGLVCNHCGARIDAYEWLLQLSVKRERLDTAYADIQTRKAAASEELADLLRRIRAAKNELAELRTINEQSY